jgi:hypothetical protein
VASTVSKLDHSGWTTEQLARLDASRRYGSDASSFKRACSLHPLAGALDGVDDQTLFRSQAPQYLFQARDFKNGHREAVIVTKRPDPQGTLDRAIQRDLKHLAPRGEGDRERNIEYAVRRAKKDVRHKCKAMMVNALWTLTYKNNLQDRDLVLKHFDAFRRRVAALFGEWRYIATLEKQERGAYHVHLATHALPLRIVQGGVKVKSWDVMRAIWRSCAGEHGGNFDEAKRTSRWSRHRKPIKGAAAIASYIAGYVAKDMHDSELNKKRYSASKGIDIPQAYKALFHSETTMRELIELAYAAVGHNITRAWFDATRGIFFLESDDSGAMDGLPGS